jgi:hypothetical protein
VGWSRGVVGRVLIPKARCHPHSHRFMRKVVCADGRLRVTNVGVAAPLPADFCFRCKKKRFELEGVFA